MSNTAIIIIIISLIPLLLFLEIKENGLFSTYHFITPQTLEKQGYILLKNSNHISKYKETIEYLEKANDINFTKFDIYKKSPVSNAYILAYFKDKGNDYYFIEVVWPT